MQNLDLDAGIASIVAAVRETHGPIYQAIENGGPVTTTDCARLSGVVQALLGAIDARLPQSAAPAVALQAVA